MKVEDAVWGATSAFSSTTRVLVLTLLLPSTTEEALPIPRDLTNDILAAIPLLPNDCPLVKINLILQNTDKYCMSWRRFLFVHKLSCTFDKNTAVVALCTMRLGWWSTLLSFLVNGLSPFWNPLGK